MRMVYGFICVSAGQEELLGIDEDEVELEGEEDIEELPGPSYPEPPIRE